MDIDNQDIGNYLLNELSTSDETPAVKKMPKINISDKKTLMSLDDPDKFREYQQGELGTNDEDSNTTNTTATDTTTTDTTTDYIAEKNIKIQINKLLKLYSQTTLRNMFNPQCRIIRNYIPINNQNRLLDININADTNDILQTKWNISYGIPSNMQGFIDVNFRIRDIVAMRMQALTITCRSTFMQDQISRNRISVLIEELQSQAFVTSEGNKFHFIGNQSMQSQGPSVSIQTISFYYFNRGNFRFRLPSTKLDSLTISLYNPFQPLPLDPENISGVVVQGSNPARIIFNLQHGLYQDYITISGFTTGNPTRDAALIASMNTTFTYPNFTIIDLYTITVPVNLSRMTVLRSNPVINGYRPVDMNGALEIYSLSSPDQDLDG